MATNGNIEFAVMTAALAPTCFALRSDIFSPDNVRNLEDVERGIYESIDYNDRANNEAIEEVYRRIDEVERNFSEEVDQRG